MSESIKSIENDRVGVCISCRVARTRAHEVCSLCEVPLCSGCAQSLAGHGDALPDLLPEFVLKSRCCYPCYDSKVLPELEQHRENLRLAREVSVIPKAYRGQVSIVKKARAPVNIPPCEDKAEALLRLAYAAVLEGFNGLVRVEVAGKKTVQNRYQKMWWTASGTPANVKAAFSDDKYVAFDN